MKEIEISFFKSVVSKEPTTVTVRQIVEAIRNGRWKAQVDAIRNELATGNKKQADELKRRLPYVSFGGLFEGGHKASQLKQYSQLVVADYDNLPPEELARLRALCAEQRWVMACFVTPSGKGLKVVALTDGKATDHAQNYALVTTHLDTLMGYTSDPSCKDISRGHFVSADPEAVYRDEPEPFATCQSDAETFVSSYLQLYPAREGNRNNQLFRLACEANKRGIPADELCHAAVRRMACDDFDRQEITSVVKSAYSRDIEKETKNERNMVQMMVQSTLNHHWSDKEEEEDLENNDGEELRAQTPLFSEGVYDHLPEFLLSGLRYVNGNRERDMLLLAMITVISSLIHRVTAYYAKKRYWANLYCFVVAPAASNKGVMERALYLCKYYFKEVMEANETLEKQYDKECEAYEQAFRKSRQQKDGNTPPPVRPVEPTYCYPQIPADISKARLLEHQRDNKEKGGLMFDLEADTLSSAGKQDYGNFFDYLRKFFQHEATSSSFKVNGRPIYVACPRLSVMLAGTPAQLCRMIPYSENGLISRFLLYTLRQPAEWMDVSPGEQEDEVERHFDQLAMRLHQTIKFLDSSPTRVRLTHQQWIKLNQTFSKLLQESMLNEREDFQSCIKRHGLMTLRVCMVFTALEKGALRMPAEEMYCPDERFDAALTLVTSCLEHSRLLITSIKSVDKDAGALQNPYKVMQALQQLPDTFSTAQYLEETRKWGLKPHTAKRLLRKAIGFKINRLSKGVYKKMV